MRIWKVFIFLSSAHVVIGDEEEVTLEKSKYLHDCQVDDIISHWSKDQITIKGEVFGVCMDRIMGKY